MANYLNETGLNKLWARIKSVFQEKLVSGTNIKTINNQSLLGSGNISISGGGGSEIESRSTTVAGSTGSIKLYRYGNIVFCTSGGAFRSSSSSIASGTNLTQQIPVGYRPCDAVYMPLVTQTANNHRFTIGGGIITFSGNTALSVNCYFTMCWITNDD